MLKSSFILNLILSIKDIFQWEIHVILPGRQLSVCQGSVPLSGKPHPLQRSPLWDNSSSKGYHLTEPGGSPPVQTSLCNLLLPDNKQIHELVNNMDTIYIEILIPTYFCLFHQHHQRGNLRLGKFFTLNIMQSILG